MNTKHSAPPEITVIPAAARIEALAHAARFRADKLSGQVTIVLNFMEGRPMPSEVGMHVRRISERSD